MKPRIGIAGIGVVTPLGRESAEVSQAVLEGRKPVLETQDLGGKSWPCFRVPEGLCEAESRIPRLRRSSALSHFAVAAAADAITSAGLTSEQTAGMPVVFATSDGGVRYTHRFFARLVADGPGAGSPLLFPETVYNAPVSHIAAQLGTDREATALVGDSCAAISALNIACGWLESGDAERVLVVASQECDPLATAGYAAWGFLGAFPLGKGAVISSEGAAALVLEPASRKIHLEFCAEGLPFRTRCEAETHLAMLLRRCSDPSPDLHFSSSRSTPLDTAESSACQPLASKSREIDLLPVLGEAFAATMLLRVALACDLLERGTSGNTALISGLGTSGCVAAVRLTGHGNQP